MIHFLSMNSVADVNIKYHVQFEGVERDCCKDFQSLVRVLLNYKKYY